MIATLPVLALFALQAPQIAAAPAVRRTVPFDTVLAAGAFSRVVLDVASGGDVHVTGGETQTVHVRVTSRGKPCDDCSVALTPVSRGIHVRTTRARSRATPADLQVDVEVPVQSDVALVSAGGTVQLEGIDGTVSGRTEFGSLELLRLSGAVALETKRGDVTLRQSYVNGRVHTMSGRVLLEDVAGNVEGTSDQGRVIERRVQHVPSSP
ncbi:MAG TPA: hypothetical protein VFP90_11400 [Gemmatimonadaceae bacterium]|jgi:hypothetical protein|nr:hypothetical protein [Gemmatimonadaceae bacterium]